MATTPTPASFRNLPGTLNQLIEVEDHSILKSYDELNPDEQREADVQMREEFNAQLGSEPRDPEESILDGTHPMYLDIEEQNIADFERKHSIEASTALRSYDDLSPEEQREADALMREEFEAQYMSGPSEPNDDDGNFPSYPEIVELSAVDLPRYQITGKIEDDAHGEDRTMIATALGPNLWGVTGMGPISSQGAPPLVAEVAGASLEEALRDTTLCEGFVVTPLNDAAKVERGEIQDNVLRIAISQDKVDDPFARVQPSVDTDILLSNLLRATHHALSDGAKEERLYEQLTTFLKTAEPQHPTLLTTASDFLTPGISNTSAVADALLMQAKENALRDTDPPRTLQQHLREVLKEGDDPANTLRVINQWHNPTNDAARAEEIRATIAQEWARSLATEGQPPLAIRDSLTLHLPDSEVPGQSHVAVSVRVHEEVNHSHRQEGRSNKPDSADLHRQDGPSSPAVSVDRTPESPRR